MRRFILILIILAVIGSVGMGYYLLFVRPSVGDRPLKQAQTDMKASKYQAASDSVDIYISNYPEDWRGYSVKAQALMGLLEYNEAFELFEKALSLDKDSAARYVELTGAHIRKSTRPLGG